MKIILAAIIAAYCLLQASGRTVKERLFNDLTDDYEPAVDPGVIDLKIAVYPICSLVKNDTGFVQSAVYESCSWKDERLAWTPEEYSGVNSLRVSAKYVWTPDIRQFNEMSSELDKDEDVNVVLYSDGTLVFIAPVTYRSVCSEDGDKITCEWRVGSWSYDGTQLKLQVEGSDGIDLSFYKSTCPLTVDSHTAAVVEHTYACCDEKYPSLDISIVFDKPE